MLSRVCAILAFFSARAVVPGMYWGLSSGRVLTSLVGSWQFPSFLARGGQRRLWPCAGIGAHRHAHAYVQERGSAVRSACGNVSRAAHPKTDAVPSFCCVSVGHFATHLSDARNARRPCKSWCWWRMGRLPASLPQERGLLRQAVECMSLSARWRAVCVCTGARMYCV